MADYYFNSETGKEARAKAAPRGESKLKKLFKEYADQDDIKALFDKLKEMALNGEMEAMKVMLSYLLGKPKETKDITLDASITDKRIPSWFNPDHISIINTEVKSELQ